MPAKFFIVFLFKSLFFKKKCEMLEELNSFVRKCKSESDLLYIYEERLPSEIFFHASDVNLNKNDRNLNWFDYRYKDSDLSSSNHSWDSSLYEFFPDFSNISQERLGESKNPSIKDVTFQLNYCQTESTKSNLKEFDQYGSMPNFDLSEIDKSSNEKCGKHVAESTLSKLDSFYVAVGGFVAWKLLPSSTFVYLTILCIISTVAFLLFKKFSGEDSKHK